MISEIYSNPWYCTSILLKFSKSFKMYIDTYIHPFEDFCFDLYYFSSAWCWTAFFDVSFFWLSTVTLKLLFVFIFYNFNDFLMHSDVLSQCFGYSLIIFFVYLHVIVIWFYFFLHFFQMSLLNFSSLDTSVTHVCWSSSVVPVCVWSVNIIFLFVFKEFLLYSLYLYSYLSRFAWMVILKIPEICLVDNVFKYAET